MKILVTGGSGFIGSNFINHWLNKHPKDSITNLDLMTYCANPLTVELHQNKFGGQYTFIKGDICDQELVNKLVKNTDLIIHFAAESHVDRSIENPNTFIQTNVIGTNTLLNAALNNGLKRFHHISTAEVFGTLPIHSTKKFTETTSYSPRSPYSASKAGADHLVRAYYNTFELPVTITNCTNNYGPFQFPEKIIPLYILRLINDKPIPIHGKGKDIRDYLHVEDHCRAIELVCKKGKLGETYCVGGDTERNTIQVAKTILEKLKRPRSLIRHTPNRPGHDPRYSVNHTKLTKELGWRPKHSFDEGLNLTIEWYKNNEAWWKPIWPKAQEIAEKYLQNTKK